MNRASQFGPDQGEFAAKSRACALVATLLRCNICRARDHLDKISQATRLRDGIIDREQPNTRAMLIGGIAVAAVSMIWYALTQRAQARMRNSASRGASPASDFGNSGRAGRCSLFGLDGGGACASNDAAGSCGPGDVGGGDAGGGGSGD